MDVELPRALNVPQEIQGYQCMFFYICFQNSAFAFKGKIPADV